MGSLKLISVHLTKDQLDRLDNLVRQGRFPNRSEAIRYAVTLLLRLIEDKNVDVEKIVARPRTVEVSTIERIHKTSTMYTWHDKASNKVLLEILADRFIDKLYNANVLTVIYCQRCNRVIYIAFNGYNNTSPGRCPICGDELKFETVTNTPVSFVDMYRYYVDVYEKLKDIVSNFYKMDFDVIYDMLKEIVSEMRKVVRSYRDDVNRIKSVLGT